MDPAWVNAAFNGLMSLIWLAYLNLFLREFKSHRRTRVFLQLHDGYGLNAACRVLNMSDKPVSISWMQLVLDLDDDEWVLELTDTDLGVAAGRREPVPASLKTAEALELGSLDGLLARAVQRQTGRDVDLDDGLLERLGGFRIRMAVLHGASDHPGAVQRTFAIEHRQAGWRVEPQGDTQLYYARRGRRLVKAWKDGGASGDAQRTRVR